MTDDSYTKTYETLLTGHRRSTTKLRKYVEKILGDVKFQDDPRQFMKQWAKKRGETEELRIPEDDARKLITALMKAHPEKFIAKIPKVAKYVEDAKEAFLFHPVNPITSFPSAHQLYVDNRYLLTTHEEKNDGVIYRLELEGARPVLHIIYSQNSCFQRIDWELDDIIELVPPSLHCFPIRFIQRFI